ncbi:xanthine dehydrogenase accessory protein XdhC [Rhodobacteraceae bacterium WD3A24]|nr:xanthine dehydrogenase accessory protein XdhC [Rhodobacteraceae bacterium WD3A24]
MSLDLSALRAAVAAHGAVIRVVVAGHSGSAPREAGAAMLVRASGQSGTIGGGALEWQAAQEARALLAGGAARARVTRLPLGPALGQCCGGAVTLVHEPVDAARLAALEGAERDGVVARPVEADAPREAPLVVRRAWAAAREGRGAPDGARLAHGWLIEPVAAPARMLWVWGAGHVGRAIVEVLAPLPDFAITWVDTAAARFPEAIPTGVTQRVAQDPADLVAGAPPAAEHLIVTYSHALDLELCHRLLCRGFAQAGLIGSATKRARFRGRLRALGHADAQIARIACPIGDPGLGKHPQAIAVGVAAALLNGARKGRATGSEARDDRATGREQAK